ncbi:MAG TPA: asparagine synthase (glutamine-hydrolyzing) [Planctomycetota bacterium]|nr:asparagine synthase (glutamine-hydrolyzing) [Planctomycetota bacterium]
MCGICGVYRHARDEPVSLESLEGMKRMLHHRGPDQEGTYLEPFVGLGHRRLSIIGVADGRQPLSNETGSIWISFNGEIYNYRPLKEWLLGRGHEFRTKTDTEVLVHLYEEKGSAFVDDIEGMFAIALWDRDRQKLLLVRDRLGKKPLYYLHDSRQTLFASELKAILAYPGVERAPNAEALHHYLSLAYVPAPLTAFAGIHSLPAGHLLEVSAGGRSEARAYWDVRFEPVSSDPALLEDDLDGAFDEAVRVRLESEVPLGVFLSGGIDSSAVAHRMARQLSRRLVSTTIRFQDPRFDESAHAGEVAAILGTDHRVHEVGPASTDIAERLLWHFDEPFADASALPTYFLCKTARESLTVALSGDGGDEMFAGYDRYARLEREERLRPRLPRPLRSLLASLAAVYPLHGRGRTLLENLVLPAHATLANAFFHFARKEKEALYSKAFREKLASSIATERIFSDLHDACSSPDLVSRAQYVDYKSYLVDDILVKVDRMSMANSLEVRSPLLDHKLVELVAAFPRETKLRDGRRKIIFKRLLGRYLPGGIVARRKQGFSVPLSSWFRGEMKRLIEDVLFDGRLEARGYFQPGRLRRLWRLQQGRSPLRVDLGTHFWILFMLELWHRKYIDTAGFLETPYRSANEAAPSVLAASTR